MKLQGRVVLKDFDVVREAGGARRAFAKEFHGIEAGATLTLELVSNHQNPTEKTAPILSGLEIVDETPRTQNP